MRWSDAINKGGLNPDRLHAKLRVACLREDYKSINQVVLISGVPVKSFNGLANRVSKYHGKSSVSLYLYLLSVVEVPLRYLIRKLT